MLARSPIHAMRSAHRSPRLPPAGAGAQDGVETRRICREHRIALGSSADQPLRQCTPRSSRRRPRGLPTTSSTTAVAISWRPLPPSVSLPLIHAPPAPCPRCSDASRRRCMSCEMRARRWSRQPIARPASVSEPRRATGSWQRLNARGAASPTSAARSTTPRTRPWRRGPWPHDRSVRECRGSRLSGGGARECGSAGAAGRDADRHKTATEPCRRRDSNPRHADHGSAALLLYRAF